MASRLDPIAKAPAWQLVLGWVLVAALIVVGWWFLFYSDAVAQRVAAEAAVTKSKADMKVMEEKRENYQRQIEEQMQNEKQLQGELAKLPLTPAAVSNLMRKFQQNGRLVGVEIKQWTPEPEQNFENYAKLPIKVRATGTWHQFGELFRRATEMTPPVNIEDLNIRVADGGAPLDGTPRPLEATFTASTFRFIDVSERGAPPPGGV